MTCNSTPPEGTLLSVHVDVRAGRAAVFGELDMCTGPVLADTISTLLRSYEGDVHLDLRELRFLDPGGMRALVHAANKLQRIGHRLLLETSDYHARVLLIAGLGWLLGPSGTLAATAPLGNRPGMEGARQIRPRHRRGHRGPALTSRPRIAQGN